MGQILLYIFLSFFTIQMIYWIVFMIVHAKYKKEQIKSQYKSEPVSVIVCANNELESLKSLIPVLLKQEHDDFEVIIVNDRSDDGTYDYLNAEKEKHDHLQIVNVDKVHDHINSKKYAITLGVKAAKNDALLFTDADCKPISLGWIKEMSSGLDKSTSFVLGYSPYKRSKGVLSAFIQFETRLTGIIYTAFALTGNPYMGVGRNLLYRKSLFMENNGFNKFQKITGGDDDLFVNQFATKSNTKVLLGKKSIVTSIAKETWKEFFIQKRRHISVGRFYRAKDRFLLGLFSMSHSLVWLLSVLLISLNLFPEIVIGAMVLRVLFVVLTVTITSKKFGYGMNIWTIPAFDFIYSIYIIIAGAIAIFTKKVTWR